MSERVRGIREAWDGDPFPVTVTRPPVVTFVASALGLATFVARFPGDEHGLKGEGVGRTPEQAVADLHDDHKWRQECARRAKEPPEVQFARSVEDLLATVLRGDWTVTAQHSGFDGESGEVDLKLRWGGHAPPYWGL